MTNIELLLVDDEAQFLSTMQKRLERRNFHVKTVGSAADAFKLLEIDHSIEVIILDVKMPDMDGITALRELKRLYPLIEVIMLTGHATVETAIEGMRLGAYDYLLKPCDIDELVVKVQRAGEVKRGHEEKIVNARLEDITRRRI